VMRIQLSSVAVLLGLTLGGCGGGGGGSDGPTAPQTTFLSVTFEYRASTKVDRAVDFKTCTAKQVRFAAHLHFTWNDWEDRRYFDKASADLYSYAGSVPVGQELKIALHDPNKCLEGDVYVAPENLYANGVLLHRVVGVDEGEGLAFRLESDGRIVP
jgi:hypothetical protein